MATSTVHLINVPLDPNYKNEITFGTEGAQSAYFISCKTHSFLEESYIRKGHQMNVLMYLEDLWNVNYLMFQNEGKWFYAFVTDMKWINNSNTEITFEIDVYQTWLFNTTIMKSFVIREHVNDDTIGNYLLDEGLETGEYIPKSILKNDDLLEIYNVVAYSDGLEGVFGGSYSNVFSGMRYRAYKRDNDTGLLAFINSKVTIGKADSIAFIFTIPKFLLGTVVSGSDIPYDTIPAFALQSLVIDRTNLDGYYPKNRKMFTSPYTMVYASNNKGGSAVYKLEDFDGSTVMFGIGGEIGSCPTVVCIPMNYKKQDFFWEEALSLSGFPLCSWNNDIYANWLAQNKTGLAISTGASIVSLVAGAVTANPIAIGGGVMGALSQMSSVYTHSLQPDQAKGSTASGGVNVAFGVNTFIFSQMEIKYEYAERIDNFFEMYGYKINNLKVPNTTGRPYWNFVQTMDINIKGAIPQQDMQKLKSIYDKGITLWHNGANVGNYDLVNH